MPKTVVLALVCAAYLVTSAAALPGQTKDAAVSFDAASIRALENSTGPFHYNVSSNRLDVKNMNLRFLVEDAFGIADFRISGPAFLQSRHFDIVATTGSPVSREQMRLMLRNLLVERFHLTTHMEPRTESIYRMELVPGGAKMPAATEGYAMPNSPMSDSTSIQFAGPMSMPQLAAALIRYAGKPVVDATGLDGFFTVRLKFARVDIDAQPGDSPLLAKAVMDQLGLRLTAVKEPLDYLIVDHVDEAPTAN